MSVDLEKLNICKLNSLLLYYSNKNISNFEEAIKIIVFISNNKNQVLNKQTSLSQSECKCQSECPYSNHYFLIKTISKAVKEYISYNLNKQMKLKSHEQDEKEDNIQLISYIKEIQITNCEEYIRTIKDLQYILKSFFDFYTGNIIESDEKSKSVCELIIIRIECIYSLIKVTRIFMPSYNNSPIQESEYNEYIDLIKEYILLLYKLISERLLFTNEIYLRGIIMMINYYIDIENDYKKAINLIDSEVKYCIERILNYKQMGNEEIFNLTYNEYVLNIWIYDFIYMKRRMIVDEYM